MRGTIEKKTQDVLYRKFQSAIRRVQGTFNKYIVSLLQDKVQQDVADCNEDERTITSSNGVTFVYPKNQWVNYVKFNMGSALSNQVSATMMVKGNIVPFIDACIPAALRPRALDLTMFSHHPAFDEEYTLTDHERDRVLAAWARSLVQTQKKYEDAVLLVPDPDSDSVDRPRAHPVLVVYLCLFFVYCWYWSVLVGTGRYWLVLVGIGWNMFFILFGCLCLSGIDHDDREPCLWRNRTDLDRAAGAMTRTNPGATARKRWTRTRTMPRGRAMMRWTWTSTAV